MQGTHYVVRCRCISDHVYTLCLGKGKVRTSLHYCILYTVCYELYTIRCTIGTVQYTLYTMHYTLYTMNSTPYTMTCKLYTLNWIYKKNSITIIFFLYIIYYENFRPVFFLGVNRTVNRVSYSSKLIIDGHRLCLGKL